MNRKNIRTAMIALKNRQEEKMGIVILALIVAAAIYFIVVFSRKATKF